MKELIEELQRLVVKHDVVRTIDWNAHWLPLAFGPEVAATMESILLLLWSAGESPTDEEQFTARFIVSDALQRVVPELNRLRRRIIEDADRELILTAAARVLDEHLAAARETTTIKNFYHRGVRAQIFAVAREHIDRANAGRLSELDARGGPNQQVEKDRSPDAQFRDAYPELLDLWQYLRKLKNDDAFDTWADMAAVKRVKDLQDSSRANVLNLFAELDEGKRVGRAAQASLLAVRHAAMNVGDPDLLKLDDRTLEGRLSQRHT